MVSWATRALDDERRRTWNNARVLARAEGKCGRPGAPPKGARPGHEQVRNLQHADMRCGRTPKDLTEHQHARLAVDC